MISNLKYLTITKSYKFLICTSLLVFSSGLLFGQSQSKLQQQRSLILKQIESTSKILAETKKNKKGTLDQYNILQKQVDNRKQLLQNLNEDIEYTTASLCENEEIISLLQNDIDNLQQDVAHILRSQYRQRLTQHKWIHILSASSMRDVLLRYRYVNQFSAYSKQKSHAIQESVTLFKNKSSAIDSIIKQKKALLELEESHSKSISLELIEKNQVLTTLRLNEAVIKRDLKKQKEESERLNRIIEDIIAAEVVESKTDIAPIKTTTKEAKTSSAFAHSKGQMQWPIDGFITSRFGKQDHPTIPNVVIQNNGIDIRAERNTNVRSIYSGTVTKKLSPPGFGNMIIIKNGEYLVVYARLGEVYVNEGDDINQNQTIGKVAAQEGQSTLQLQIWKADQKLNPSKWLKKNYYE